MTAVARFVLTGLRRQAGKTSTRVLVLAAAVALIGAMSVFVAHSLRTMTGSAVRSVPLDWQAPIGSYGDTTKLAGQVARQPGVAYAAPAAAAPFAGITHSGAAGNSSAGNGSILAIPPDYSRHVGAVRFLQGRMREGALVLDQQLAATLQARIGDTVAVTAQRGKPARRLPVSGIVLVQDADVLFQPLNPLLGPAAAQPPADIAVMPVATFAKTFGHDIASIPAGASGAAAVPGAQRGIQWQIHAQADPRTLTGTPSHALTLATRLKNRIERSLTGRVQIVDNLSDSLTTASQDSLYADALYIMLAIPGAIVAMGLAYLAALGSAGRDRHDLALLRARGASRRQLVLLALSESAVLGVVAGALGTGLAIGAARILISGDLGLTAGRVIITTIVCMLLAAGGAAAARLGASGAALRASVAEGRRGTDRPHRPLWQRLYLDLAFLGVSGLVYWLTARTGFSAVVNPDSNPTLSLSIYMFLAPALLWLGATLLLVRLRGRAFSWAARRAVPGGRADSTRGFLLASASRRGPAINRGLLLVGLLLAFGVSLGLFSATYDQQANVDANLTLGADVVAQAPPGLVASHNLQSRIAKVPGVAGTTSVDHSYAYVGPDLQDTFGIDTRTITKATTLRDSYFLGGGSADQNMARLRARPDGVLVSKETISDYSLHHGDLLKLRVLDHRTGQFHVVPFHVVGTVQEFPSAPRDSFMVANARYLEAADHAGGPNVVFARTTGDPPAVARRVAHVTRGDGALVKDIRGQTAQTVSSITSVDLSGISKIEEAFAIALAAGAMWLFVTVALAERRHELATMAAVGASMRTIGAFLRSETVLVLLAGFALASLLGFVLAEMLVAMLQHVFDPPPDHLAVPWRFLGELTAGAVAGATLALVVATRAVRRLPLGAILREQ